MSKEVNVNSTSSKTPLSKTLEFFLKKFTTSMEIKSANVQLSDGGNKVCSYGEVEVSLSKKPSFISNLVFLE